MKRKEKIFILERLGVYGMNEIEPLLLAGLVTGDPVLLVGPHGSAKTLLCSELAKAMNLKFWAYDASKALFEDIIGFPNPYDLKKGRIGYVSTPLSIWDKEFVLIDEISRANYQTQGKWLELIRSRTIMGQRANSLKYIFAAMNPPYYPGARPLDPALAGRFAFIIHVSDFSNMDLESQMMILKRLSEEDAILISRDNHRDIPVLSDIIEASRKEFCRVEKEYGDKIDRFILRLKDELVNEELYLDGRRASMLRRSIIALIAVEKVVYNFKSIELEHIFRKHVPFLLPYSVERENFNKEIIEEIIESAICTSSEIKTSDNKVMAEYNFTKYLKKLEEDNNMGTRVKALLGLSKYASSGVKSIVYRFYNTYSDLFNIDFNNLETFIDFVFGNKYRTQEKFLILERQTCLALWVYFALYKNEKHKEINESIINEIVEILNKYEGGEQYDTGV